jgi:hypothetical protein
MATYAYYDGWQRARVDNERFFTYDGANVADEYENGNVVRSYVGTRDADGAVAATTGSGSAGVSWTAVASSNGCALSDGGGAYFFDSAKEEYGPWFGGPGHIYDASANELEDLGGTDNDDDPTEWEPGNPVWGYGKAQSLTVYAGGKDVTTSSFPVADGTNGFLTPVALDLSSTNWAEEIGVYDGQVGIDVASGRIRFGEWRATGDVSTNRLEEPALYKRASAYDDEGRHHVVWEAWREPGYGGTYYSVRYVRGSIGGDGRVTYGGYKSLDEGSWDSESGDLVHYP